MPDGRTHTTATIIWSAASLPAGIVCGQGWHSFAITAGAMVGLVLTPDLDIEKGSFSHYIIRRYFGLFSYWIWFIVWWPYAKVIAHRSPVSHFPVFSTALRVGYLLLLATPFIVWSGIKIDEEVMRTFSFFFFGLACSDSLHITMDRFWRN
jgi:uncharacterized metal-binding protein